MRKEPEITVNELTDAEVSKLDRVPQSLLRSYLAYIVGEVKHISDLAKFSSELKARAAKLQPETR